MKNTKHPHYRRWTGILQAVRNKNSPDYKWAGARGIEIDFGNFKEFAEYIEKKLGPPPTPRHRLHRKNQEKNYAPGNLMWALQPTIGRKSITSVHATYRNKTQSLMDWSEEYGIPYNRLITRYRKGWSMAQCLDIKPGPRALEIAARKKKK